MSHLKRDHGGNLDAAMHSFGGDLGDWIDLSTGINPVPYPVPDIALDRWTALPRAKDMHRLRNAAAETYEAHAPISALAGAQGAIQLVPNLMHIGTAKVLSPTYNEHAAALRQAGWIVQDVADLADLRAADIAIVVNPNNPDGKCYDPDALMALSEQVGLLVVDESFADPQPDISIVPHINALTHSILVLRSFGKFYGLAGVRLGFAVSGSDLIAKITDMAGPWPVTGPAIDIAAAALTDRVWRAETTARLSNDAAKLDKFAGIAGWSLIGGTSLFRTYHTPDAEAAQRRLAERKIWSRIFPYSPNWIRLGLAGTADEWERIEAALSGK